MTQNSLTILDLISQSPTTSVYRAHQNVLDRTVLLKVLHKHLLRDKELVARFSREAKACAILRSENIVQVYDLTEVEGAPAIVMEYVEGKSLADLLENKELHSEKLMLDVAVSVLKALSYAHGKGITHRDIKPGNILVSEDGTIKVTDFGLAAVSDAPSLTMEGSLIGTPAYMSPEQARGEAVDQRTDLFSLGVTLVEVLTGDKILAGRSYAECITRIQAFDLKAIDYVAPQCSPHVFEFLKRLLAPDKHDRFSSAGEALMSLGEPRKEDSPISKKNSGAGKKGRRTLLAGTVIATIALFIVLSLVFRRPQTKLVGVPADSAEGRKSEVVSQGIKLQNREEPTGMSNLQTANKPISVLSKKKYETKEAEGMVTRAKDTLLASKTGNNTLGDNVAARDSGYISINCTPWAKIFVDSEFAGTSPISGSIKIPVGEHTVTFNNPNFAPIVKRVDVRKDFLSSVDVNFLKNAGYLVVSVDPWGKVYVDDQFRETTPSANPILVSAGIRRIRIQNPNFPDLVKTITVLAGDTLRLSFDFLSKEGN